MDQYKIFYILNFILFCNAKLELKNDMSKFYLDLF